MKLRTILFSFALCTGVVQGMEEVDNFLSRLRSDTNHSTFDVSKINGFDSSDFTRFVSIIKRMKIEDLRVLLDSFVLLSANRKVHRDVIRAHNAVNLFTTICINLLEKEDEDEDKSSLAATLTKINNVLDTCMGHISDCCFLEAIHKAYAVIKEMNVCDDLLKKLWLSNTIEANKTIINMAGQHDKYRHVLTYLAQQNFVDNYGRTVLHIAAMIDNERLVPFLIDSGLNVNAKTINDGITPLMFAAMHGKLSNLQYLLSKKAEVNAVAFDRTALQFALILQEEKHPEKIEIVENLVLHGANVFYEDFLNFIVKKPDLLKSLIEKGFDVNRTNIKNEETLLIMACKNNLCDAVALLINNGANIYAEDQCGRSPICFACEKRSIELVSLLIKNKRDIIWRPSVLDDVTALHWACYTTNNLEIVQLLIKIGANINARDKESLTPLHYACLVGDDACHGAIVKLLLDSEADVNAVNNDRRSPLHFACEIGNLEIVQLLLKNGANVDAVDKDLRSPLHFACKGGHLDIVEYLVGNGADVNTVDMFGWTPLDIARTKSRNSTVVSFLETAIRPPAS